METIDSWFLVKIQSNKEPTMKRKTFMNVGLTAFFLFLASSLSGATLYQILFSAKTLFPDRSNVVVFVNSSGSEASSVAKYAAAAKGSLKLNVQVIGIADFSKVASSAPQYLKSASDYVVIISDNAVFNTIGKKFVIQKAMLKKIPVVTDKEEDFESGACYIFGTQKLVNSKVAGLLGVSIPDSMKSDPTVTVR